MGGEGGRRVTLCRGTPSATAGANAMTARGHTHYHTSYLLIALLLFDTPEQTGDKTNPTNIIICHVRVYANALFFVLYDGGESEVNVPRRKRWITKIPNLETTPPRKSQQGTRGAPHVHPPKK